MSGWTIVIVERLAVMWKEGHSASEIGKEIGFSRNAVLGKVFRVAERMGLEHRKPMVRSIRPTSLTDAVRRAPRRRSPQLLMRVVPENWRSDEMKTDDPKPKMLSVFELAERSCRAPYGDPGSPNFGFCGHETIEGKSYCPHHHQILCRTIYRAA